MILGQARTACHERSRHSTPRARTAHARRHCLHRRGRLQRVGDGGRRTALGTVRRDLEMMSVACRQSDGQLVENTGDWLLLLFASAVQAVHCAIEIQRRLGEAAHLRPAADTFEHRIGVHLGDVVLSAGDAFGDGVNVAARLQEHADPGGIWMSQTVFEVVRSSLAVPVEGPQRLELKNVETVQALRIGPRTLTGQVAPRRASRTGATRGYAWIAAGIVVLGAAIAYVGYSLAPRDVSGAFFRLSRAARLRRPRAQALRS